MDMTTFSTSPENLRWIVERPARKVLKTRWPHHANARQKLVSRLWTDLELAAQSPDVCAGCICQPDELLPRLNDHGIAVLPV